MTSLLRTGQTGGAKIVVRICMFASNDLISDPRVTRHAETLGRLGHKVIVVCAKSDRTSYWEERECYLVRRPRESTYDRVVQKLSRLSSLRKRQVGTPEGAISGSSPLRSLRRLTGNLKFTIVWLSGLLNMTWQFTKLGIALDADIYVSNDLDTLLAGVLCRKTSKILVYDAHELWPDMHVGAGPVPSPLVALFRISERLLLTQVDCVITVNEFISQELQRRYRIQKPHVVLNVPKGAAQIQAPSFRPHAVKIALYQGRYARIRGLENLVHACKFLNKDVVLVFRGYGEIETELREIAKPFANCRFEEPVPPAQLLFAASSADIGIVAYLPVNLNNYLASPNKLFEYIQAGLPVVASDLPFLRKIVTENGIGYVFDARSPQDIARSINLATRDENLRILKSNVLKIRHRYSWQEEEKKLAQIYTDVELRLRHK